MTRLVLLALAITATTWTVRAATQPVRVIAYVLPSPPTKLRQATLDVRACPAPGDAFVALLWDLDAELALREAAEDLYTREVARLSEPAPSLDAYHPVVVRPFLSGLLPASGAPSWRCEDRVCSVDVDFDGTPHATEMAIAFTAAVNSRYAGAATSQSIEGQHTRVQVAVLPPKIDGEPPRVQYHRRLARERRLEHALLR